MISKNELAVLLRSCSDDPKSLECLYGALKRLHVGALHYRIGLSEFPASYDVLYNVLAPLGFASEFEAVASKVHDFLGHKDLEREVWLAAQDWRGYILKVLKDNGVSIRDHGD